MIHERTDKIGDQALANFEAFLDCGSIAKYLGILGLVLAFFAVVFY